MVCEIVFACVKAGFDNGSIIAAANHLLYLLNDRRVLSNTVHVVPVFSSPLVAR